MSAILREALIVQDEANDEPKTLLEIGVAVKRPITTRTTIITPTPIISHSQHLLHHLTSAPAPPATSSSNLQHHLSSQFTPIHQVHRPIGQHHQHQHHHHWNDSSNEMVSPIAFPLHRYSSPHTIGHLHNNNGSNNINNGNVHEALAGHVNPNDVHMHIPNNSAGMVEHKNSRMANASWKDRAIQIERGV